MSLVAGHRSSRGGDRCITCGDDGVAMTVVSVERRSGLALCADDAGATRTVETALLESLSRGDRVLVHADVAIAALPSRATPPAGGALGGSHVGAAPARGAGER